MPIRPCESCVALVLAGPDGDRPCPHCGGTLAAPDRRRHADEPEAGAFADATSDRSATVFATASGTEIRIPAPGFTRSTVPGLLFLGVWLAAITGILLSLHGSGKLWPEGLMIIPFVGAALLIARTAIGDAIADRVVEVEPEGIRLRRGRGGKAKRLIDPADVAAVVPRRTDRGIGLQLATGATLRVHRTIDGPRRDRAARLIAGAIEDVQRG